MKVAWFTDIGERTENQDSLYVPEEGYKKLFIVSDGMGGHQAGSVASRLATTSTIEYVEQNRGKAIDDMLKVAVAYANTTVIAAAKVQKEYSGMGTTLTGAYIDNDVCHIINIGDSRAYHYTGDKLVQVTRDHSYVQELVDSGAITQEQARTHPRRNVLTQAIGVNSTVSTDLYKEKLHPGDIILLCSDGLYDGASNSQIFDAVHNMPKETNKDLSSICEELNALSRKGGSSDNLTVILIKYEEEDAK